MTDFTFDASPGEDKLAMLQLTDQLCDMYGFPRELAEQVGPILDKHLGNAVNACSNVIDEIEALPAHKQQSIVTRAKISAVAGSLVCIALSRWLENKDRVEHSASVLQVAILHTRLKGL